MSGTLARFGVQRQMYPLHLGMSDMTLGQMFIKFGWEKSTLKGQCLNRVTAI